MKRICFFVLHVSFFTKWSLIAVELVLIQTLAYLAVVSQISFANWKTAASGRLSSLASADPIRVRCDFEGNVCRRFLSTCHSHAAVIQLSLLPSPASHDAKCFFFFLFYSCIYVFWWRALTERCHRFTDDLFSNSATYKNRHLPTLAIL